ncbi:hypothetical protein MASR1M59_13900 [Melaminivora sp.]
MGVAVMQLRLAGQGRGDHGSGRGWEEGAEGAEGADGVAAAVAGAITGAAAAEGWVAALGRYSGPRWPQPASKTSAAMLARALTKIPRLEIIPKL